MAGSAVRVTESMEIVDDHRPDIYINGYYSIQIIAEKNDQYRIVLTSSRTPKILSEWVDKQYLENRLREYHRVCLDQ